MNRPYNYLGNVLDTISPTILQKPLINLAHANDTHTRTEHCLYPYRFSTGGHAPLETQSYYGTVCECPHAGATAVGGLFSHLCFRDQPAADYCSVDYINDSGVSMDCFEIVRRERHLNLFHFSHFNRSTGADIARASNAVCVADAKVV